MGGGQEADMHCWSLFWKFPGYAASGATAFCVPTKFNTQEKEVLAWEGGQTLDTDQDWDILENQDTLSRLLVHVPHVPPLTSHKHVPHVPPLTSRSTCS